MIAILMKQIKFFKIKVLSIDSIMNQEIILFALVICIIQIAQKITKPNYLDKDEAMRNLN
jgi:hypothetical protein